MDELAQLMDELTLALKKRAEVGARTEELAREVRALPNLAVAASTDSREGADDVVARLHQRLQLQNLVHAKQEALNAMQEAVALVAQLRQTVSDIAGQSDEREAELVDDYTERIRREQDLFAEIQERKRDLLFDLARKMERLETLERSACALQAPRNGVAPRP